MFSPMFFANIGISLDYNQIGEMFKGNNVVYIVLFCIAFVIFGMAAKFVGCGIGAKICKYSWSDSCKVGIGMMVRGEVCLIVANTGKKMGLISEEYYPAIILLIIISSILTPLFLKMLYKKFPHVENPEIGEGMENIGQGVVNIENNGEDLKNCDAACVCADNGNGASETNVATANTDVSETNASDSDESQSGQNEKKD